MASKGSGLGALFLLFLIGAGYYAMQQDRYYLPPKR